MLEESHYSRAVMFQEACSFCPDLYQAGIKSSVPLCEPLSDKTPKRLQMTGIVVARRCGMRGCGATGCEFRQRHPAPMACGSAAVTP